MASLGVPFAVGGAVLGTATDAVAQDYTSGVLAGSVTDENGNGVAGATVTITSQSQGFSRSTTTSASGTYRFSGLPTGRYDITVGGETQTVSVLAGGTAGLDFVTSGGAGDEIVVTATRQVDDFANTTTGLNVNVEELAREIPVGRDLASLIQLAPGTSLGDSAFGNVVSIGGSSVAENAYYINGLNITDFDTYLGGALVPFDFYRTVETKSGGYPAEFGRATGGIVNATTKSGSNDFFAAIHGSWTPDELRADGDDIATSGGQTTLRSEDIDDGRSLVFEMGGPLIRDRLFAYGLIELRRTETGTNTLVGGNGTTFTRDIDESPFWGIKLDAYPIDDHHLEFTYFDTRRTIHRDVYQMSYSPGVTDYAIGNRTGSNEFNRGGINYVGQYTGHFTDWFTFSAAYGEYNNEFENILVSPTDTYFRNVAQTGNAHFGVPDLGFYNAQRTATIDTPYTTTREFIRADADFFFNLLGDHHVRIGYDREQNLLEHTSIRSGPNANIFQLFECAPDDDVDGFSDTAQCETAGLSPGDPYLEVNHYNAGGTFDAENTAYYIQDEWQLTDRLTLNLGIRRDNFSVSRADGVEFISLEDNDGLRLGASYDLFGDGSGTLYASFSQYFLPVASNTAYRMTGFEEYFREYWELDVDGPGGMDGVVGGQPNFANAAQIIGYGGANVCPFGLLPGSAGAVAACRVTGDGSTAADPSAYIDANLEATQEDEYILGYRHRLDNGWTFGINYTYRELVTTAEDAAIDQAVLQYCIDEGLVGCETTWTGFHQYVILNPGSGITVPLDGQDGRIVSFTAEELGYAAAERTYNAVEITFERERQEGDRWSLAGSYTWSESEGNSEGFVQSDFGQDDAGITQDFDQPGFLDGAYGLLPNHREHRLKLWGSYFLTDNFSMGTQIQIASPRPLSCFGLHPQAVFDGDDPPDGIPDPYLNYENVYGAASHYCDGELSPRGTASETDWLYNVDLSARYNIEMEGGQQLTLRADIFNVFNFQQATERNEFGETNSGAVNPSYDFVTAYQPPRAIRLGFDLTF
jgi:outer membrane receptor protein involved in Fe transport